MFGQENRLVALSSSCNENRLLKERVQQGIAGDRRHQLDIAALQSGSWQLISGDLSCRVY
jgi:hypothetical protein